MIVHKGSKTKREEAKARKRERKAARERMRRDRRVTERYGSAAHGSCGRKVRYRSIEGASQVMRRHPSAGLAAYRCEYCGGWHLTSHPRPRGPEECEGNWESQKAGGSDT